MQLAFTEFKNTPFLSLPPGCRRGCNGDGGARGRGGFQVAPGCPASEASRVFFAPQARKFWDFKLF